MEKKYIIALSLSILLHLGLAVFLFAGDFSVKHKPTPMPNAEVSPIQAVAIDKSQLEARVNQLKKQKSDAKAAEQKRIKALEDRAAKAKAKRAKEQERIKSLEKQRKKKEAEKKKADAAAKKAKAIADKAEKSRKQKVAEQKKAEQAAAKAKAKRLQEEKAAEKAAKLRKQREEEKKRKAREAKERELQEAMLAEQMAAEMAQRQQARNQQVMTEVSRLTAQYKSLIYGNILGDAELLKGKQCIVTISLTLEGKIKYVTVNSGEKYICDATEKAVYRVNRFPMSESEDVNRQLMNVKLTFSPQN